MMTEKKPMHKRPSILCAVSLLLACSVFLASCSSGGEDVSSAAGTLASVASTGSESGADTSTSQEGASSQSPVSSQSDASSDEPVSSNGGASSDTEIPANPDVKGYVDDQYIEGVGYELTTVVNKEYRMTESSGTPKLVTLPDSTTDRAGATYKLDERAAEPLAEFLAAAREEGFLPIVYSTYRTYQYQANNYENALKDYMEEHPGASREDAVENTVRVAPPGTSEHCIGLAVDIYTWSAYSKYGKKLDAQFESDPLAVWMKENAHKYGFILRYPKDKEDITMIAFEPWHFRYVGVEAATEIYEKGLCLEEYTGQA